jgi:hypothetical protein
MDVETYLANDLTAYSDMSSLAQLLEDAQLAITNKIIDMKPNSAEFYIIDEKGVILL